MAIAVASESVQRFILRFYLGRRVRVFDPITIRAEGQACRLRAVYLRRLLSAFRAATLPAINASFLFVD